MIEENIEKYEQDYIKEHTKTIHSYSENYVKRLQQENQQLKEDVKELNLLVGIRQKRTLISKFDKEYDEEDKKKKPNRDYVVITPDAEEVYKRYYELKEESTNYKQALNKIRDKIRILGKFDGEKCTRGFSMYSADFNDILQIINEVLGGDEK